MASTDYRLCDLCEKKAFYDVNLSYERSDQEGDIPFKIVGKDFYGTPEMIKKYGCKLGYLGDWAVLCTDCAKTHKTQIVKIEQEVK